MTKTFFVAVNQTPLDADCVNFDRDSLSLQELKEAILKLSKP